MKALSFQQPWAELILQGRKTLDLRTFNTHFRGEFAIHASQEVRREECAHFGLDPAALPTGVIVGVVRLVDAGPLSEAEYEAARDRHLRAGDWKPEFFGWTLADPRRLPEPIPARGRMGWFSAPDELLADPSPNSALTPQPPLPQGEGETRAVQRDPARPFDLYVTPDGDTFRLALDQWPTRSDGPALAPVRLAALGGPQLQAVLDAVLAALRAGGYKPTDLTPKRRAPFHLPEAAGARLALVFWAVAPLTRFDRIETIARGLAAMPAEETLYWFSKCSAPASAPRARQALRVLLAGE